MLLPVQMELPRELQEAFSVYRFFLRIVLRITMFPSSSSKPFYHEVAGTCNFRFISVALVSYA